MIDPARLNKDLEALWLRRRQAALSRYGNRDTLAQLDQKLSLALRTRPQPDASSDWLALVHDLWQAPSADILFGYYIAQPDRTLDWLAWRPIRCCFSTLKQLWHSHDPDRKALVLRVLARHGEEPINLELAPLCNDRIAPALYSAALDYIVHLRQNWAQDWLASRLSTGDRHAAAAWLALNGPIVETASSSTQESYTLAQSLLVSADIAWLKNAPYDALRVLLLSGTDRQLSLWINQFSRTDQELAMLAMGLSGRGRYIHWLTEVASTEANMSYHGDALHLLTGWVPETASNDLADQLDEYSGDKRLLGGQPLIAEQLPTPEDLSQRNRYQWAWYRYWHGQTKHFDDPRRVAPHLRRMCA